MGFLDRLRSSDGSVEGVIRALLPGESSVMDQCRREAEALCKDVLSRGALLLGNFGSGKTTLARALALGRYVHLLGRDRAQDFLLRKVHAEGTSISATSLPWFVELAVPSLTPAIAGAQLFGFVPKTFSGAPKGARGVFERAARGHIGDEDPEDDIPEGARATGGVVFLDEIGDLPMELQPTLLAVIAGSEVHRVGGEGAEDFRFAFQGLTVGATWKPLTTLRPDLLSRFQDHIIRIPSLSERLDDLPLIVDIVLEEIKFRFGQVTESIKRERFPAASPAALVAPTFPTPTEDDFRVLKSIEWGKHGEVRGLSQIIWRAARTGSAIAETARRQVAQADDVPQKQRVAAELFERLIKGAISPEKTIVSNFSDIVLADVRKEFVEYVEADPKRVELLAQLSGKEPADFRKELYELKRPAKPSGKTPHAVGAKPAIEPLPAPRSK